MNPQLPSQTIYHTSAIRQLLVEAFSDEEFTIFCYDYFRKVHQKFSTLTFSTKIQLLIEHCENNDLFPKLLTHLQTANPAKYAQLAHSLQTPPLAQPQPLAPPSPASLTAAPAHILVVEDDPTWQAILQECLVEAGHQVHLSATFDEARQQLRYNHFQLVTLDARLQSGPQTQEGLLLLNYIRHQLKTDLPIIIISGEIARRDLIRAFRDFSVSNVLLKEDFDYDHFTQAVKAALAP